MRILILKREQEQGLRIAVTPGLSTASRYVPDGRSASVFARAIGCRFKTKIRAEVDRCDLRLRNDRLRRIRHWPGMEAFVVCARSAQGYKDKGEPAGEGGLLP